MKYFHQYHFRDTYIIYSQAILIAPFVLYFIYTNKTEIWGVATFQQEPGKV